MNYRTFAVVWLVFFLTGMTFAEERCLLWIDLYRGEPVAFDDMVDDLAGVGVVFIGEAHRVQRHHDLQAQIVGGLSSRGKKVLLGIEQMEANFQPQLDQYNRGEISFEELTELTNWTERWSNNKDYEEILEAAITGGGKVVALNAKAETIRAVGRQGLDKLEKDVRNELPQEMVFDEPLYEKLLNKLLLVHMAFSEDMLKKTYHAQVSRDEMMAQQMANAWSSLEKPKDWIGVVLCGSGHCSYGLGTVSRLARRLPGLKNRIVLMTESGDTVLTEKEKAMKREIELTHEDLRFLNQPIADYLHAIEQNPNSEE